MNNIPLAIRLSGGLDVEALRRAVRDVIARHESLRTVFPDVDGVGTQAVLPVERVTIELEPEAVPDGELIGRIESLATAGFDLAADVPVRAALFRLADDEHVLAIVVHHIASDGFSMAPLARDVMTAYAARSAGEAPAWAPLAVQYADYTLWQREVLGSEDDFESVISRQVSYWTEQLADLPEQLDLPSDRRGRWWRPTTVRRTASRSVRSCTPRSMRWHEPAVSRRSWWCTGRWRFSWPG